MLSTKAPRARGILSKKATLELHINQGVIFMFRFVIAYFTPPAAATSASLHSLLVVSFHCYFVWCFIGLFVECEMTG